MKLPQHDTSGANAAPAEGGAAQAVLENQHLQFFKDFVQNPKSVKFIWRYNLCAVNHEFLETWNRTNPDGKDNEEAVPIFKAPQKVVEEMAPLMLLHYLEGHHHQ